MTEIRADRASYDGRYGWKTEINKDTLAACDEFQMARSELPDAAVGDVVRVTAPDGAQKDFRIVKAMTSEWLLRSAQEPKP
jgi:hypothetical protein